jgi:hypothetical protein
MDISLQLVPNNDQVFPSPSTDQGKNLNDQFRITQRSALRLRVLFVHQLVVRLVQAQDCPQEETHMANHRWRLLPQSMPKVDSRNQRASNILFRHPMLRVSQLVRWMRALVSQARNEDIRSSLAHLVNHQRAAIGGPTLSLRLLDV